MQLNHWTTPSAVQDLGLGCILSLLSVTGTVHWPELPLTIYSSFRVVGKLKRLAHHRCIFSLLLFHGTTKYTLGHHPEIHIWAQISGKITIMLLQYKNVYRLDLVIYSFYTCRLHKVCVLNLETQGQSCAPVASGSFSETNRDYMWGLCGAHKAHFGGGGDLHLPISHLYVF